MDVVLKASRGECKNSHLGSQSYCFICLKASFLVSKLLVSVKSQAWELCVCVILLTAN